jgi:hypothetical protein
MTKLVEVCAKNLATVLMLAVITLIAVEPAPVYGQASPSQVALDITVPDAPAFTILGVSPTQIERPTNPTALGVSLLSSTSSNTNFIPNNYALQVAPYWLGRPGVSFAEYAAPSVHQSMAQTLTVSFATAKSASGLPNTTDLGAGIRVSFFAGHVSRKLMDNVIQLVVDGSTAQAMGKLANEIGWFSIANPNVKNPNDSTITGLHAWPEPTDSATDWTNAVNANLGILFPATAPQDAQDTKRALEAFFREPTRSNLRQALAGRFKTWFLAVGPDTDTQEQINAMEKAENRCQQPKPPDDCYMSRRESAEQKATDLLNAAVDQQYASDVVATLVLLQTRPNSDGAIVPALASIAVRLLNETASAIRSVQSTASDAAKADAAAVRSEDTLRRGWILSVAGALAGRVPNDSFSDSSLLRWGAWVTPAFRADKTGWEVISVAKYLHRPVDEGSNLFDFGARGVKDWGRAALSAEYLERIESRPSGDHVTSARTTVNFDYKITDKLYLTAAFGKDFADPTQLQSKGGLVSALGLNIGFGSTRTVTTIVQ